MRASAGISYDFELEPRVRRHAGSYRFFVSSKTENP